MAWRRHGRQVAAGSYGGYSSVGKPPALQAGGQGFESLYLPCSVKTVCTLKNCIQTQLLKLIDIFNKTSEVIIKQIDYPIKTNQEEPRNDQEHRTYLHVAGTSGKCNSGVIIYVRA